MQTVKKARIKNGIIHAHFDYKKNTAKHFHGHQIKRRWVFNTDLKVWEIPLKKKYIRQLEELGFTLSPNLLKKLKRSSSKKKSVKSPLVKGLKLPLRKYQEEGVRFIKKCKGRAIIGDDMGVGKTAQLLGYIQTQKKGPTLIICPASVKYGWEEEFHKFGVKGHVVILNGRTANKKDLCQAFGDDIVYILNFDIADAWKDLLIERGLSLVVIDEVQFTANMKSLRSKAVSAIAKSCKKVVGLSGTPIVSSPKQFFPVLNMIRPDLFPSWWQYAHKYCDAKKGFGGRWDFNGASNTKGLNKVVSKFMIRRMKSDVLTEIPIKTRTVVPIQMSSWKNYKDIVAKKLPAIEMFTALRLAASQGKLKSVIQWIKDYFEEGGTKLVLFAHHRETILAIEKAFAKKCVKIMGGLSAKKRKEAVQKFQKNDKIQLFLGNIAATGTGLNGLQDVASNAVVVELPWTPGALLQVEDRLCRSGQTLPTNIYYLMAHGTMDITIAKLLIKKMTVLNAVVDGTDEDDSKIVEELSQLFAKKEVRKNPNPY